MKTRSVSRSALLCLLRGLVLSVVVTAALVLLFALLISIFNISDSVIRMVNQLIKLTAIAVGVFSCVRDGDERGLMRGALLGAIYMAVGVALYAILTAQHLTLSSWAADVLMGIAAGGLIGLLRARR